MTGSKDTISKEKGLVLQVMFLWWQIKAVIRAVVYCPDIAHETWKDIVHVGDFEELFAPFLRLSLSFIDRLLKPVDRKEKGSVGPSNPYALPPFERAAPPTEDGVCAAEENAFSAARLSKVEWGPLLGV